CPRAMDACRRTRVGPEGSPDLDRFGCGARRQRRSARLGVGVLHPRGRGGQCVAGRGHPPGLPHETAYAPGNITQNSAIRYAFPNIRTVCHRLAETPFRPSWIRTPGRMQNSFANEAFMDELDAAAGADPLEFRLKYLKDPRGVELLQRLAVLAKWEKRPSPQ